MNRLGVIIYGCGVIGTVAVTINTIPKAVAAPAGLLAMKDLPPTAAVQ